MSKFAAQRHKTVQASCPHSLSKDQVTRCRRCSLDFKPHSHSEQNGLMGAMCSSAYSLFMNDKSKDKKRQFD